MVICLFAGGDDHPAQKQHKTIQILWHAALCCSQRQLSKNMLTGVEGLQPVTPHQSSGEYSCPENTHHPLIYLQHCNHHIVSCLRTEQVSKFASYHAHCSPKQQQAKSPQRLVILTKITHVNTLPDALGHVWLSQDALHIVYSLGHPQGHCDISQACSAVKQSKVLPLANGMYTLYIGG